MVRFAMIALVTVLETGGIFLLLKKIFGRPALRRNIMLVLYGLAGLGLFLKGWFDTVLLQWAAINFMLFFLLAVFYRGDMKRQALVAAAVALLATGLDAALKLAILPVL
ncbi:MAG: hypothetical protein ACLUKQ_06455 [Peptococcaceae bacterium]